MKNKPSNFTFQFLNFVRDPWPFPPGSFDIVHCRFIAMHIPNFPKLLQHAIDATAPGGILMFEDEHQQWKVEGKPVPHGAHFGFTVFHGYLETVGVNPRPGSQFASLIIASGKFSQTCGTVVPVPMGPWTEDKNLHVIGEGIRSGLIQAARGLNKKLYEYGVTDAIVEGLVSDLENSENKLYMDIYFAAGTDQDERHRLNAQHYGIKAYFGGNHHSAHWPANPRKILDIGVGTGAWATEIAEEFPMAEVVGVDITEPYLGKIPPNFTFKCLNVLTDPWSLATGTFDVVNCRFPLMHVPNFGTVLDKAIEVVPLKASRFFDVYWSYCKTRGVLPGTGPLLAPRISASKKFSEVHELVVPACMSPWPKDERLHAIGEGMRTGMIAAARSFIVKLQEFGLTNEIVEDMIEEALNPDNKMYVDLYFVWARKKVYNL
ncbi:hypothetical protein DACRYDRAFT_114435 [Dacryopinax primogenitus]|uniref:Methyltransferase domain-containing protein n=1 Tax=Dacryopinax primogenitus (strain DJM 731) TaxID=1858805 RepID=M5G183_DACPD|nr:uncharacterized protein DACRYDRAFT_114435 [Dacryopinax primogenitus]EJU03996.1 hypothetical protein DACRYDRAFT_114435 [Dacryopinax primogenitus]